VGRIGTVVRVSVSFRQKYPLGSVLRCPTAAEKGVMTKGLCARGVDFRLRRITSSASQTIRSRLVRTATDAAVSARLDAFQRSSQLYYAPAYGALSGDRRPSSVRPSVCLMSRTSALTRKPKGLGSRNFAQEYPRSHATPTPTSRSKGQKSRSRGGGILWRPPSRTACFSHFATRTTCMQCTIRYDTIVCI